MKNKKQEEKVSGEFTNNFSKNEFFDDCLICQAMKAAKNEAESCHLKNCKNYLKR